MMPASKPTFFSPLVNCLKYTCTSTGCSVYNHWAKIFPTEELGQLGWVLWISVLWQHCKTGRSIHERRIGWCRDKSGSGCLHWVCTVVYWASAAPINVGKFHNCRSICSFCLSPGDAMCRTGHWTTASPAVLHPLLQKLLWAWIKRDGRKMEPTNLSPLLGLGAAYPGGTCPLLATFPLHGIPPQSPGCFTSILSLTKEYSANSQPIIPRGRMPEDLIFMAVGMSCALQNTLQKSGEGLGRNLSSQGHRLPWGKVK